MAEIDPSIALSYRPPNLATMPNLQVQTPLESLARVVSLRSLMQEGQLKGLQLQQLQMQLQGARNLANMYNQMYPDTGAGLGIPGTMPGVPAGGTAAALPSAPPPAAPLAGGAPITPAGVDVTAGLDKYLTPPAPAPATPYAGTTAAPAAAPGVLPGTPPPGLFAPAPEPQTPSLGAFVRADPLGGVAAYEQMMKARKEMYDEADKRLTLRKSQSETTANLLNGVTDQESLVRNLPGLVQAGGLSGAQADYIRRLGYDNPWVQKWVNEKQIQSISYDKAVTLAIANAKENRDKLLFPPQLSEQNEKARQAEATSASNSVDQVLSDKDWPGWFKTLGDTAQVAYGPVITNPNLTLDQKKQLIKLSAGGATKVAEAGATEAAKHEAEMAPYEAQIQGVLNGQYQLQDFSQAVQDKIGPEIATRLAQRQPGAAPAGTPQAGEQPAVTPSAVTPSGKPGFQGFGKQISDDERQRLTDLDNSISLVEKLKTDINDPYNRTFMGPPSAGLRYVPGVGTNIQKMQADYGLVKQKLKGFVTNKSLRGLTPEGLDDIMPSVSSPPSVNDYKVQNLLTQLKAEREQFVKNLAGKVVPPGMTPPTSAQPTPPPAQPTTPSKTSTAGPAATKAPADVQDFLKDRPWGRYKLNDGRVFYKTKDGQIVPFQ